MTRIDFYLLSAASGGPVAAVCRLCEKAASAGHRLYVLAHDDAGIVSLDDALWSLRQGGFTAHERYASNPLEAPLPPVLIGRVEPPDSHRGILVNLTDEVPPWFSSFERVLEVVPEAPEQRARSRDRYRFYRERGYELGTFEQSANGAWQRRTAG